VAAAGSEAPVVGGFPAAVTSTPSYAHTGSVATTFPDAVLASPWTPNSLLATPPAGISIMALYNPGVSCSTPAASVTAPAGPYRRMNTFARASGDAMSSLIASIVKTAGTMVPG
jgi:hypothetical protein